MPAKIHSTAIIEDDVKIGEGTSVWDNVHIRHGAEIGEKCIVGEKSYIAYDVKIGNLVKINAMVYICAEVTIEDGVMISASTTFTNDRFPRATFPDLKTLRPSEPDEHTLKTLVREGATIGAGCIIGNDLEIGRWAMVGMGSIVTKSVPDFHLVLGSPARSIGAVCKCGQLFHKFDEISEKREFECVCGLRYEIEHRNVKEINRMNNEIEIWKWGSHWGGRNNANSHYDYMKEKEIVFGRDDYKYSVGDLVIITDGYTVKAITMIEEEPKSITENSDYPHINENYSIDHEGGAIYAKADWYELPDDEVFSYEREAGKGRVRQSEIIEKVLKLWNSRNQ